MGTVFNPIWGWIQQQWHDIVVCYRVFCFAETDVEAAVSTCTQPVTIEPATIRTTLLCIIGQTGKSITHCCQVCFHNAHHACSYC